MSASIHGILPAQLPGFWVQADVTGPLPDQQRLPGSTDGERVVLIRDDTVATAMVSRFPTQRDAEESVTAFAQALFSSDPTPMSGLERLSEDARGAVGHGEEGTPGAIVMIAWSRGSLRLDLSISVLRPGVDEQNLWAAFPRADVDEIAAGMRDRADEAIRRSS